MKVSKLKIHLCEMESAYADRHFVRCFKAFAFIIQAGGGLCGMATGISASLSVSLVFAVVHLVSRIGDRKTARELSRVLKEAQGTHPRES